MIEKRVLHEPPLEKGYTYAGKCCRIWEMSYAALNRGRCGLCGEIRRFYGWIDG